MVNTYHRELIAFAISNDGSGILVYLITFLFLLKEFFDAFGIRPFDKIALTVLSEQLLETGQIGTFVRD